MANEITVEQAWEGVDLQLEHGSGSNDASTATVHYIVSGTDSENDACTACYNAAPATYSGIPKRAVSVSERLTDTSWKIDIRYGAESATDDDGDEDEATVNFDCGSGSMHVTTAISQTCVYSADGKRDSNAVASVIPIGWNGKYGAESEVAGVDVSTGDLRETYTKVLNRSTITGGTWKRKIAGLRGKVNASTFKGWHAGEAMFLGASYSAPLKGSQKVAVSFHFSIRLNEDDATIGGVNIGSCKGHEYLWAITSDKVSSGERVPEVKKIYKSKVCNTANFSDLGL